MTLATWTTWLTSNGFEHLFEIKPGEQHTFDEIAWSPGTVDSSAAWEFYTELRTRITTHRALGEHIAQDLFRSDLVGRWETDLPVREWFDRLATHLLD